MALELPFVSEARYVGRYGWVTASRGRRRSRPLEWMRESYFVRAPERLKPSAWEE